LSGLSVFAMQTQQVTSSNKGRGDINKEIKDVRKQCIMVRTIHNETNDWFGLNILLCCKKNIIAQKGYEKSHTFTGMALSEVFINDW